MVSKRRMVYRNNLQAKRRSSWRKPLIIFALLLVIGVGGYALTNHTSAATKKNTNISDNDRKSSVQLADSGTKAKSTTPVTQKPNPCAANELSELVLVSISQRHLWACAGTSAVFNSAVVTGMENLPADLTPVGTYHIYAKEANLYLNGSDSTGSWHDYVYYWMPFLDNQYGAYGLHDATWRPANAFGNISPYSSNASHGCVELPLATAKWIYNWVSVGTTVTIES